MISCQSLYMQAKVCQIETEFQFGIACHTLLQIINGKAKLFKYQFGVGNLSFMDFPAFTFCKGCEGQPGGW